MAISSQKDENMLNLGTVVSLKYLFVVYLLAIIHTLHIELELMPCLGLCMQLVITNDKQGIV
jgi:hypothetical protein